MLPILQLQEVHVTLGGAAILHGVSLELARGEVGLLVGRSGCGKSVLLKATVGFLPMARGQVVVQGVVVDPARQAASLRRRVVLVHQESALLDDETALDNVALPVQWRGDVGRTGALTRAREALEQVGALPWADAAAVDLPAGVRKLVAMARALAVRPGVMLLDEPTTGLDVPAAWRVGQVCGEIARAGTTLLVVTHDVEPFRACARRVWVMHAGVVVEQQEAPAAWGAPLPALAQLVSGAADGPLGGPSVEA